MFRRRLSSAALSGDSDCLSSPSRDSGESAAADGTMEVARAVEEVEVRARFGAEGVDVAVIDREDEGGIGGADGA